MHGVLVTIYTFCTLWTFFLSISGPNTACVLVVMVYLFHIVYIYGCLPVQFLQLLYTVQVAKYHSNVM